MVPVWLEKKRSIDAPAELGPNQRSFIAMQVKERDQRAPMVMTWAAVCTAVRRTNWIRWSSDRMSWNGEHGVIAAEAHVG